MNEYIVKKQWIKLSLGPLVFPDHESFKPQRWIETNGGTSEMREHMFVWGYGNRICAGQNMAIMEIKIMAARITEKYNLRLASEKTHDDMVMMDHFIGFAKGHSCPLIFERRKG